MTTRLVMVDRQKNIGSRKVDPEIHAEDLKEKGTDIRLTLPAFMK
tara:strand:- start:6983 stop:7117 length:135 start_codon:yes stop_codon:yes gene_type:complete